MKCGRGCLSCLSACAAGEVQWETPGDAGVASGGKLPGLMLLNLSASYLEEVIYSILMTFSGGT